MKDLKSTMGAKLRSTVVLAFLYLAYKRLPREVVLLIRHTSYATLATVLSPVFRAHRLLVPRLRADPANPEAITKEWLEAVLQREHVLTPDQHISSVSVTEFEAGKTGRAARIVPTYWPASPAAAPRSFVVKMSREDFVGRLLNLVLQLHRESYFYQQFVLQEQRKGNGIGLNTPVCYYASVSPVFKSFVVVLEDLAPADDLVNDRDARAQFQKCGGVAPRTAAGTGQPTDGTWSQIFGRFGADVKQTEDCVMQAATMHAKYWQDPALLQCDELAHCRLYRGDPTDLKLQRLFVLAEWKKTRKRAAAGGWPTTPWSPALTSCLEVRHAV